MTLTIQFFKWSNNYIYLSEIVSVLFFSKQASGRAYLNPSLAEIQVSDRCHSCLEKIIRAAGKKYASALVRGIPPCFQGSTVNAHWRSCLHEITCLEKVKATKQPDPKLARWPSAVPCSRTYTHWYSISSTSSHCTESKRASAVVKTA